MCFVVCILTMALAKRSQTQAQLSQNVNRLSQQIQGLKTLLPTKSVAPSPPRRRRSQRPLQPSQTGIHDAHQVCAITNPFCEESKGSKWPDGSAAYSVGVPFRKRIYLTTDANGRVAELFTSDYSAVAIRCLVDTNNVASFVTRDIVGPFPSSDLTNVRLVSAGIKFTSTLAPMVASGSVTLIELPADDGTQGADPLTDIYGGSVDLNDQNRSTYLTVPLRVDKNLYGILRPSGPESRIFNPADPVSDPNVTMYDWSSLMIAVSGAPASTTVGFVDVYYNFEFIFEPLSASAIFQTRAAPDSSVMRMISQKITRSGNGYLGTDASVDNGFISNALSWLGGAVRTVVSNPRALANAVGAGVAARTGNYQMAGHFAGNSLASLGSDHYTAGTTSPRFVD